MKKTYIAPAADCTLIISQRSLLLPISGSETDEQWVKGEKSDFEDIWGTENAADTYDYDLF
ncbi:MAG: hypothetical protein IJ197_01980 [Bacteroidaceae bacterium]|nr:hypothetical protein [Bacteroidaceae bacterium]